MSQEKMDLYDLKEPLFFVYNLDDVTIVGLLTSVYCHHGMVELCGMAKLYGDLSGMVFLPADYNVNGIELCPITFDWRYHKKSERMLKDRILQMAKESDLLGLSIYLNSLNFRYSPAMNWPQVEHVKELVSKLDANELKNALDDLENKYVKRSKKKS